MYIKEIITEISKAERDRRAAAARREKLAQQQAAKDAEEKRIKDIAARKLQKTLPHAITPPKPQTTPTSPSTGAFSSPELEKYRVDDKIDTDWEGGYYLRFQPQKNYILAYWGRDDSMTPEHAIGFKQIQKFSLEFDPDQFQSLIDRLVSASSQGDQPGYVHIEALRKHFEPPYKDFFSDLHMYLLLQYPRDDVTTDASVNWELI